MNACKGTWLQNGERAARLWGASPNPRAGVHRGALCTEPVAVVAVPSCQELCHSQEPGRIGIGEVVHASSRGSTDAFQPDLLARCVRVHNLHREQHTSNAAPLSCSHRAGAICMSLTCNGCVRYRDCVRGNLAACSGRRNSCHCGSNMGRGSHSWAPKHQGLQIHGHHTMNPLLFSNLASPGRAMSSCSQMSASSTAQEHAAQPDGSCPISEEHWNVLDGLGSLKAVKYASSGLPPTHSL